MKTILLVMAATLLAAFLTAMASDPDAFVTALEVNSRMGITVFPATWDFENPTFPPQGFTCVDVDGAGTIWEVDTNHNTTPDGSKSALHYASDAGNQDGWLILPAVLMPEDSFMTLSFQHRSDWSENYQYCSLLANSSPDPQDPGWAEIWAANSVNTDWNRVFVDVTDYIGEDTYFAFRYQGNDANYWYLDDITIYEAEPVTSLPVYWDFEGTEFPPAGWSIQDNDGQPWYWLLDTEINHTPGGSNCAAHWYSSSWEGGYGQDGWLITPPILLPQLRDQLVLDFWHNNFYMDCYAYSGVMIRPVNLAQLGWHELWNPDSVTEEWQNVRLNISPFAGMMVHFAFVYRGYDAHSWFVDDVTIRELTNDDQPPIITFLPPLSTPSPDISFTLTAEVEDDPIWQSGIDEVTLHYQATGTQIDLPMENISGNTWSATIPPQDTGTRVEYFITATDGNLNTASTGDWDNFHWFAVDNYFWLFYNWSNSVSLGRQETFGAANRFANPFYELGSGMLLSEVAVDTPQPVQADLHIYSDDGFTLTDLTGPITYNFNGLNYYDLPDNLVINTPYFYVSVENVPGGNGVWFTNDHDYGMSYWREAGYFSQVEGQGSWIIQAHVAAGLAAPEISFSLWEGVPKLSWDPVPFANDYLIYASSDPYANDGYWTLLNTTTDTYYCPDYVEAQKFFRIKANNTPFEKAAWYPEHIPHAKKAIKPKRERADKASPAID